MPAINLLPKDLTPREGVLKTATVLRKVLIIGFIGLIVLIVSLIAVFFILSGRFDRSIERQNDLKKQISALEQTEVRLVLVKDRLAKAKEVLALDSAEPETESLDSLINIIPDGVGISLVSLKSNSSELTMEAQNSSSLAEFLAKLISSGIYKKIDLMSIEFNDVKGYEMVFKLII